MTVPKRAVPHTQVAVVLQKHHPLARREVALVALDGDGSIIRRKLARDLDPDLLRKLAALPEYRPRVRILLAHVGPSVGPG